MKKSLVDVAERAGATLVQSFAAALTLGSATDLQAFKVAAIAGGYAVVKFLGIKANQYLSKPEQ